MGQTISLDCRVDSNPNKSVHFSWFWTPAASVLPSSQLDQLTRGQDAAQAEANQANESSVMLANLADWLQRDAGIDEQIDESR